MQTDFNLNAEHAACGVTPDTIRTHRQFIKKWNPEVSDVRLDALTWPELHKMYLGLLEERQMGSLE